MIQIQGQRQIQIVSRWVAGGQCRTEMLHCWRPRGGREREGGFEKDWLCGTCLLRANTNMRQWVHSSTEPIKLTNRKIPEMLHINPRERRENTRIVRKKCCFTTLERIGLNLSESDLTEMAFNKGFTTDPASDLVRRVGRWFNRLDRLNRIKPVDPLFGWTGLNRLEPVKKKIHFLIFPSNTISLISLHKCKKYYITLIWHQFKSYSSNFSLSTHKT